jgi:protein MpaA
VHAVKATPFDPPELVRRFEETAKAQGFRSEHFETIDACPLVALTRRRSGPRPRIYLSSGIHGDEPAAPLALLRLLEDGVFDDRAVWFLVPMLNPSGFKQRTRENIVGHDLNRDYREPQTTEVSAHIRWLQSQPGFDVAYCLHEDWEATGFYLYELNPQRVPSLAEFMISAVGQHFAIDRNPVIDGRPACDGIIRPESNPAQRDRWPEAIYLRAHHSSLCYTLESPSAFGLSDRIEILTLAVKTGLHQFISGATT